MCDGYYTACNLQLLTSVHGWRRVLLLIVHLFLAFVLTALLGPPPSLCIALHVAGNLRCPLRMSSGNTTMSIFSIMLNMIMVRVFPMSTSIS